LKADPILSQFKILRLNLNAKTMLFSLVSYLFVFQPPFVSKYLFVVFFAGLSAYVYSKYGLLYLRKFGTDLFLIFFIVCIPLLRDIITGEVVYSDRFFYWFLQSCVFSYFLAVYAVRKNINLFVVLYLSAFIAATSSILAYIFPAIDDFFTSILDDAIYDHYSAFEFRYRAFGFSEHLTFSYGIVLGFFAGLSLLLSKAQAIYLLFVPLFLAALLINARIGVIVFCFFALIYTFQAFSRGKALARFIVYFFVAIPLVFYFSDEIQYLWNSWYFGALRELYSFALGSGDTDTLDLIMGDFIIVPETLPNFLFGTGVSIYTDPNVVQHSDIGFILQLNYAGILFTVLLHLFMFYIFLKLVKLYGVLYWFPWVFLFIFLIMNTKGFFFAGIPGTRLLFLMYLYLAVSHYSGFGGRFSKVILRQ